MSSILEAIEPSIHGKSHELLTHFPIDHQINKSIMGMDSPIFIDISRKTTESFIGSSIKSESYKAEPLSPLAQLYYEAIARANDLQGQLATFQAQANLNAQKIGEAEVRAEIAEAKVEKLSDENEELKDDLAQTRERLEGAFQNEQRLLNIIDDLRGRGSTTSGESSDWAILGLDPKTAFAGLTPQQRQIVLDGAYRTRSRIFHPDNGGDEEQMKQVNSAYETLKKAI